MDLNMYKKDRKNESRNKVEVQNADELRKKGQTKNDMDYMS